MLQNNPNFTDTVGTVKEQIAQDVNAIFAGTREVIRVSFGQFIIQ